MTKRTTHFATKTALKSKTPTWAINMVGLTLTILPIIHYVIQNDPAISETTADRIILYTDAAALLIAAIAKLFGVTYTKQE